MIRAIVYDFRAAVQWNLGDSVLLGSRRLVTMAPFVAVKRGLGTAEIVLPADEAAQAGPVADVLAYGSWHEENRSGHTAHVSGIILSVETLSTETNTRGPLPMVGRALCMAPDACSIHVGGSRKFTARYNQAVDGHAHNVAGVRSTRTRAPKFIRAVGIPANGNIGRVTFEQTRPDQLSRPA